MGLEGSTGEEPRTCHYLAQHASVRTDTTYRENVHAALSSVASKSIWTKCHTFHLGHRGKLPCARNKFTVLPSQYHVTKTSPTALKVSPCPPHYKSIKCYLAHSSPYSLEVPAQCPSTPLHTATIAKQYSCQDERTWREWVEEWLFSSA